MTNPSLFTVASKSLKYFTKSHFFNKIRNLTRQTYRAAADENPRLRENDTRRFVFFPLII